jgi:SRSO17 transposase
MAAVIAPARVSAQHQSPLHFLARWSDELMLAKVHELVMPSITHRGPIEAWIIDDTSFPKTGRHPLGVHHQPMGQLGKQASQVAVTLSIANHHAGLPITYRLYLTRAWINDRSRRTVPRAPARSLLGRSNAKSGQREDN